MTNRRTEQRKAYERAYSHAHLRKRTPEEDFMANLLDMGRPSSVMPLVDSVHVCDIAVCHDKTTVMLCWPHWKPVVLCARHERMRKAKRTK